jgi:uncharacterized phage infection (PIP) family protein YhgE
MTVASAGSAAASSLEALAPRCRREQQLRALAQALRDYRATPTQVDAARGWAGVDLFTAFLSEDPGLPEPEVPARRWALTSGVVQILIFLPILLTWASLAFAAFDARAGQSMLQAWEAGSVPGLALRDVALYTAAIVGVLIAMTAALAAHRWRLEKAEAQLRQELAEVLTGADLELSPLRIGITRRIAQELDKAADKLSDAADAIETAGQTAGRVQQAAVTAVTATIPALADVETAARASRDAAVELGTVPGRLALHLDQITAAVGEVTQADRDLVTSMDGAAKQLADSVASSTSGLTTSASDLAATTATSAARIAGALDNGAGELRAALESGAGELRAALDDVTFAAAGYASRTEVASDIIGRTHQALTDLPAAVDGLHGGVSGIEGQLAQLTTALTAAKEAAALLLEAVSAQRDQPAPPANPLSVSKEQVI